MEGLPDILPESNGEPLELNLFLPLFELVALVRNQFVINGRWRCYSGAGCCFGIFALLRWQNAHRLGAEFRGNRLNSGCADAKAAPFFGARTLSKENQDLRKTFRL